MSLSLRKRKPLSSDSPSNSRNRSRSIGLTQSQPKPAQPCPPAAASSSLIFAADNEDSENQPPGSYNSKSQLEKDIVNASALRAIQAKSKSSTGRMPHKWFDKELALIQSSAAGALLKLNKVDIQN
jgi:hypothetical protein